MRRQSIIRAFFDEPTNTVSYIVADPATKQAAVKSACRHSSHACDCQLSQSMASSSALNTLTFSIVPSGHSASTHQSLLPLLTTKNIGLGSFWTIPASMRDFVTATRQVRWKR